VSFVMDGTCYSIACGHGRHPRNEVGPRYRGACDLAISRG
jgi:hypothetical protein